MVFVAIDPGLSGGIAVFQDGSLIAAYRMPTQKTTKGKRKTILDTASIIEILKEHQPEIVIIEMVHSRPGQGVSSMFNFGHDYGMVKGICIGMGIEVIPVTPAQWKGYYGIGSDKNESLELAREKWPEFADKEFKYKKNDGLAEAALIGGYWNEARVLSDHV